MPPRFLSDSISSAVLSTEFTLIFTLQVLFVAVLRQTVSVIFEQALRDCPLQKAKWYPA